MSVAQSDIQSPLFHVYCDGVAVHQGSDRTSLHRFGHDMPDDEAARCAGEPAVGDQSHAFAESGALKGAGHELHLAHPGPSLRALVAQYHDVVRLYATFFDRGECIFLALEHPRGAAVKALRLTGDLHYAAAGGEIASENGNAALLLQRTIERLNDILALGFARSPDLLPQAASCHGPLIRMKQTGFKEPLAHDRHSSSRVHLRCRIRPPRPQIREHRRATRQAIKIADGKRDGEIAGRCQKVKHRIRGSTRRQHASDCILETPSRDKRSRGHALVDEPDGSSATLACGVCLQRIEGRNIVRTHGRDAEHLVGGGHRVGGELTSASTSSRARVILDVL